MVQYGFYFDQGRCIGCNACTAVCKQWHQIPPGPQKWMRVYQWEKGSFFGIRLQFLAIPCYHCERPACVKACPKQAIFKDDRYGAVLINPDLCDGCKKCWIACPYGSIMFSDWGIEEKASKCNMCIDRLEEGKIPICVLSCSMRAFEFGPLYELEAKFGNLRELDEMPSGDITQPSVVFKRPQEKRQVISWDREEALKLLKKRGPHALPNGPDLFAEVEDITSFPPDIIGRSRLVLKAKNLEEFMYYTSDDD